VGRIQEPGLQSLVGFWSPLVKTALEQMGSQNWPPHQERRGFLKRPKPIPRFMIEGPAQRGGEILWAVSHTVSPSAFDQRGRLSQGQREYWIVGLETGGSPRFRIEGAEAIEGIPADQDAFQEALVRALAVGPKQNTFYGNRGPLSQP